MATRTSTLAALGFALSLAAASARAERLVVAYENRSGDADAVELVSRSCFEGVLARKGYEVADGAEVAAFVSALQIPRVDPLPQGLADRMTLRFHADGVVAVVINFVLADRQRSRGPRAGAAVGISAKLIARDGRARWRNSLALLPEEAPLSAGRDGRAGALEREVAAGCERLLFSFPRAKAPANPASTGEPERPRPRFPLVTHRPRK